MPIMPHTASPRTDNAGRYMDRDITIPVSKGRENRAARSHIKPDCSI